MTKQGKYYLPEQISLIYHFPKPQYFPEKQMYDPTHKVSQQSEINHSEKKDLEFQEGQIEQDVKTNSFHMNELLKLLNENKIGQKKTL